MLALILLTLAGGDCVEDIKVLEADDGLCEVLKKAQMHLNAIMKTQVLGKSWVGKRMKAMRFSLIKLPGRVLKHARELIIRLTKDHPCFAMLVAARKKIMLLQTTPSG